MGPQRSWWAFWAAVSLLGLAPRASEGWVSMAGQEFLTAFLQNNEPGYGPTHLYLLISNLANSPATVTVLSQVTKTSETVTVDADETITVNVSSVAEMTGSGTFPQAIVITSDSVITVQAVSSKPNTAELFLVYPSKTLGTEYFVFTPPGASVKNVKEFAVVAGATGASVSIQLKGWATFQGRFYPVGSTLAVDLAPYVVAQVQSTADLSGSRVLASSPVAVLSGHSCAEKHTSCNYVVEQLLPRAHWGSSYVVPAVSSQARYDIAYVVAGEATQLTFNHGGTAGSRGLQAGDVVEFDIRPSYPLYLSATAGIQVLLFGTGATRGSVTYDPFLALVPPVNGYCSSYVISGIPGTEVIALVVAKTSAVGGVTVDGRTLESKTTWVSVPGSQFSYAEVSLGTDGRTHSAEAGTAFGLLTLGMAPNVGFGTAAACGQVPVPTTEASCAGVKCGPQEYCQIVKGKPACLTTSTATCWAPGNPHYTSFDGRRFDFMGTCVYLLAGSCGQNAALPDFQVLVENEHRGSQVVSYTRAVRVQALGVEIAVRREYPGRVLVDGVLRYVPYKAAEGQIQIFQRGYDAVIRTNFGLTVSYDWNALVKVQVPGSYADALCGLCGNFNDDPKDDFTMRNGTLAPNALAFGQNWQEEALPGCGAVSPGECPQLDALLAQQLQSKKECGILKDPQGPFRDCHAKVDPEGFFHDCVYDRCLLPGQPSVGCDNVAAYVAACNDAEATVHPWRSDKFCPLTCPVHSHYESCSRGCPASCNNVSMPGGCGSQCQEGCVCDDGFALSGEDCVPLAQCGCLFQGVYYHQGQYFYPGPTCDSHCHCGENGMFCCKPYSCGPHEACKVANGALGCVVVGSATCSASGDPHYTTFDGRKFDYMGTCVYTLVRTCGSQPGLEDFEVLVENVAWGNGAVSVTRAVTIRVAGVTLVLEQRQRKVKVDGVALKFPVSLLGGRVRAYQHGKSAVIQTDFGLRVAYDLVYNVRVTVPGNYHSQLCGLCGNYNGNPKDDFQKPDGQLATNPSAFGDSWEAAVPDSPCVPVCNPSCPEEPECKPELAETYEQEGYCGLITSSEGPFAACHALISPSGYLKDCVFDLCLGGGGQDILCDNIHAYVSACQAAGGTVQPWRNEKFCPLTCPPNSHYEICANTCSLGCAALSTSPNCPETCAEGCQCDVGFVSDGQACIRVQDCGCYVDGRYYELGESALLHNCSQQCKCHPGQELLCQDHKCGAGQVCESSEGLLSCVTKDPCHAVTCLEQEKCQVQNGQGVCVPKYNGTCWLWGDPHYHSFDGRDFDFQGTCSYVLAVVCGGPSSLPNFTIITKNENRGNPSVSYVRQVSVSVHGTTISIHKGETGQVRVNGVLTTLPVSLADGHLTVTQGPGIAVLETSFGLRVTYDWYWRVEVTLPSSYHGAMCGLCGNFDGSPGNDMAFPNGTQASSIPSWGGSWRVLEWDPFCWDECQGNCPTCAEDKKDQYGGPEFCGPLAPASGGPFSACHAHIKPDSFFTGCVLDVCLGGGSQDILCQALASYVAACQAAGITIGDWRTEAKCPYPCGENSHYELCGPACPSSCPGPNPAPPCAGKCREGCQCDEGFILSGSVCVARDGGCGCWANGTYYEPGTEFWADESCSSLCRCDHGQLLCSPGSCGPGQECAILTTGLRGCWPLSSAVCQASGNPHYVSLDGRRFDFLGSCEYLLSGTCNPKPGMETFFVSVANSQRGNRAVPYTREVTLNIHNHSLSLSSSFPYKLKVNDKLVALPFQLDTRLRAYLSVSDVVIETAFGLTLSFDGNSLVRLRVPSSYAGTLCGLCGDYNGDPANDLTPKGGQSGNDPVAFGQSWKVGGSPDCGICSPSDCPDTCDEKEQAEFGGPEACGMISAAEGPFASCHGLVDPTPYFQDCLLDTCQAQGHPSGLCPALASYVAACQAAGAQLEEWRRPDFCPFLCPANSHYQLCGDSCPRSCPELSVPKGCVSTCREGCVCDAGFVLSGVECVPLGQCGCLFHGVYYHESQSFYPGPTCDSHCQCGKAGIVSCKPSSCGPHEACQVANGALGCVVVGSATCSASGDPHYTTFDGRKFDYMGTCVYTLVRTCGSQPGLEDFEVLVENVAWGNGAVSVTKAVTVLVAGVTLVLEQRQRKVKVDGVALKFPVSLLGGRVRAYQHGKSAVIQTDFGLRVAYDLVYNVRVTVPGNYHSQLCGLCGNYNGNPKDDFQKPDGQLATNPSAFGDSWEAAVPDSPCVPVCNPSCPEEPECKPELAETYEQEGYCGLITSSEGPFAACHALISPSGYLKDCVFDLCLGGGGQDILCDNIHAYVSACQAAGGTVQPWRNEKFCPLTCPPNSHYEICADTCSLGCAALSTSPNCPETCAEGCQCDVGFVSDGQACIRVQDCGCYVDGRYYELGESALLHNCSQQCKCHPGQELLCQDHKCGAGQVCESSEGLLSCVTKDPCRAVTCLEQEKCQVQNGQGVCVPKYNGTCWLWGDPHYHSFDGRDFDFQGTCSYVLAVVCGGPSSLPNFTIITKNENRGNPSVSYVRQVSVSVHGTTISIHKGETGQVRVNGVLTTLPVSLADGHLTVTQGPGIAVLETSFGLRVTYDWYWRVEVTLPSSYHGAMCGLCGNFDGSPGNDMAFPNGTQASSIPSWGGSWRVLEWDPFCWDECQGNCPTCAEDKKDQYGGPEFCGPLAPASGGPFSACHAHIKPDSFFTGCVLDVCLGGGSQDILCQALASYVAACQAAGIAIGDWRTEAKCPYPCGENSHYELCGSACPFSCPGPNPAPPCAGKCREGCQCDEGFILSGSVCVARDGGCGCWANGTYYEPGTEFWADESCSSLCRCDHGQLLCSPGSCGPGQECAILTTGLRGCWPLSSAVCQASGNPHYVSLDGRRFDFLGSCEYLLSGTCNPKPGMETFFVSVANSQRGNRAVPYTREVTLNIHNHSLSLSSSFPYKLKVNDKLVALPFQLDTRLRAYLTVSDVVIGTAFGLTLSFDGNSLVRLRVPSSYAGTLCGLCGDYNGDPENDLTPKGGQSGNDPVAFGQSWKVGGSPDCGVCSPSDCPDTCDEKEQAQFGGPEACGMISAAKGPFASCHGLVDSTPYFKDCLLDTCQAQGHPSGLCPALASYVAACQAAGAQLEEWRRPDFCPFLCPANSHYQLCGDSCPRSCPELSVPEGCVSTCREGCVCDAGFVLSGDECVPVGQCGCLYHGYYYPLGQTFFPGSDCQESCECGPGGVVSCLQGSPCGPYEECRLEAGVQACYPTGCGRCVLSSSIHYVTFDGRTFDFYGTCSYVLTKVCQSLPGYEDFSIILEKDANGDLERLLVTVDDQIVGLGRGLKITLDEELVALPVDAGSVRLTQEGRNVVLQTTRGLRLLFDGDAHVLLSVPSPYHNHLCGLCGDFNSNWNDDFRLPDNTTTSDVDTFGAAWRVPGSPADRSCVEGAEAGCCPVCSAEQTAPFESLQACGQLKDPQGIFAACHNVLNPSEYFRQCIYDLCASRGNSSALCRSLGTYTADCQAAGVTLKPWRSNSFCSLSCPAHSHYSECIHGCKASCSGLSGLGGCTSHCFEGCACDLGYLLSNGVCVRIQDCGCAHQGSYLPSNSSLVSADCSQQCTCAPGGKLSCQAMSCPTGSVCHVQGGSRGCKGPKGVCSLSSTFNTFDGLEAPAVSSGIYEISNLCSKTSTNGSWFRVLADVKSCHKDSKTVNRVHIFFKDGLVTLTPTDGVWVNGQEMTLPVKVLTSVSVCKLADGSLEVLQDRGVHLRFSPDGKLDVIANETLAGKLCGACGNFDGNPTNDIKESQGKEALEDWKAKDFSPCSA